MGFCSDLIKFCILVTIIKCAVGQTTEIDEPHFNKRSHLNEVPGYFELTGDDVKNDFKKYVNDIHSLTAGRNVSVIYKVKVNLEKPVQKISKKKKIHKKVRSKKYNVPLKKQNMKLSNFEVLLRKMAEENGQRLQSYNDILVDSFTTNKPEKKIWTTKQIKLKYKPIVRRIKTNYTKLIKPVRSKIITLTV